MIKAESMEELLVKLDAWKYISYTIKVVPCAKVHQIPVAQHYLMMEDGGNST